MSFRSCDICKLKLKYTVFAEFILFWVLIVLSDSDYLSSIFLVWCVRKNDVRFVLTSICFIGSSYLFVIQVNWGSEWFPYHMMFLSFNSNTADDNRTNK